MTFPRGIQGKGILTFRNERGEEFAMEVFIGDVSISSMYAPETGFQIRGTLLSTPVNISPSPMKYKIEVDLSHIYSAAQKAAEEFEKYAASIKIHEAEVVMGKFTKYMAEEVPTTFDDVIRNLGQDEGDLEQDGHTEIESSTDRSTGTGGTVDEPGIQEWRPAKYVWKAEYGTYESDIKGISTSS